MLTLTSVLRRALRLYCERPAILDSERNFTWAQFGERVARAAGVLRSLGITRGARYEILCRNSFRNNELMHAGYWMGAVPVPVNYRLAPPEIAYVLQNSACKLLIVEDVFADLLDAGVLAPWAEKVLLVAAVKRDRPWLQYEDLLADAEPLPAHDSAEDEEAVLLYTGGTAGRPKGVRLSHRNVVANGFQVGFEFQARANDIYLHAAPMFHSADLLATAYAMAGASHGFCQTNAN